MDLQSPRRDFSRNIEESKERDRNSADHTPKSQFQILKTVSSKFYKCILLLFISMHLYYAIYISTKTHTPINTCIHDRSTHSTYTSTYSYIHIRISVYVCVTRLFSLKH